MNIDTFHDQRVRSEQWFCWRRAEHPERRAELRITEAMFDAFLRSFFEVWS